jgi:hypothetical protein
VRQSARCRISRLALWAVITLLSISYASNALSAQDIRNSNSWPIDTINPYTGDPVSGSIEGVTAILESTDAVELDLYSETTISYSLLDDYYYAYGSWFFYVNGSKWDEDYVLWEQSDQGTAVAEFSKPSAIGNTYKLDSSHLLYAWLCGDPFIPVGQTSAEVYTGAPSNITISPTAVSVGTTGSITVSGTNLIDPFTQNTTPTVTGTGIQLTFSSYNPSTGAVTLTYSISQNASTGDQSLRVVTRYGTSGAATLHVGDPSPNITSISPDTWNAGTATSFTIGGTGFGTNPSVTITGIGVTSYSVTSASDTQIQATVTMDVNAPDGTATVTVASNGYGGSGFVSTTPGQPNNNSHNVTVRALRAPPPKIVWADEGCSNGTDLAGTQQAVVVGQKISLIGCPGFSASGQSWSVDVTAITGGYQVDPSCNSDPAPAICNAHELASPNLINVNNVVFYWTGVAPGTVKPVTYQYIPANGQPAMSGTVSFSIAAPAGSNQNAETGSVRIFPSSPYLLGFGNGNEYIGITFRSSMTPPTGYTGQFFYVQLILNHQTKLRASSSSPLPSSGTYTCTPNGFVSSPDPELDVSYPYERGSIAADSPGQYMSQSWGEIKQQMSAKMYLMWNPVLPNGCANPDGSPSGTCTSVPIPLGYWSWGWCGDATNTLSQQSNGTTWILACDPVVAQNPPFQPSSTYPQWGTTFTTGTFYESHSCQRD